jgi:hypothetical protein
VFTKGIRQIQRETGHSRVTIRKVLQGEFQEYKKRSTQSYPVLDSYRDKIEFWLKEDQQSPKKQRHTARRIYMQLVEEEGFQGSEAAVRRYVRLCKAKEGIDIHKPFLSWNRSAVRRQKPIGAELLP